MNVSQYIEILYDRLKDYLHEDYLDLYPVPTMSSLRLGSVFSKQGTWLYLEIERGECPGRKFPFQDKFLFSETSCEKETSLIV